VAAWRAYQPFDPAAADLLASAPLRLPHPSRSGRRWEGRFSPLRRPRGLVRLIASRSEAARGSPRRSIGSVDDALRGASLRTWVVVVGALALTVRLPLIATSASVSYSGDTAEYMRFADQLLHGRFSTTYRMPGYPLFFAALDFLPGPRAAAIVTTQHLLGVALVCLMLVAGWRFFGPVTGVVAALLAALTPVMLGLEHTMEPDFLFGAIVFVGACALAEAVRREHVSLRWLAVTGAMFAAACYVKPVGQVLPAAALLALAVSTRSVRATMRGTLVVAGVTAILLLPWVVRNELAHGDLTLSDQGGRRSSRAYSKSIAGRSRQAPRTGG
jgi:4-amino-4-deoxy-L-arabinose transferase-like glycosyltransferase